MRVHLTVPKLSYLSFFAVNKKMGRRRRENTKIGVEVIKPLRRGNNKIVKKGNKNEKGEG